MTLLRVSSAIGSRTCGRRQPRGRLDDRPSFDRRGARVQARIAMDASSIYANALILLVADLAWLMLVIRLRATSA
jgi:hypothetical protein